MNISTVFAEKKENSTKLKRTLGLLLKYKPLWLIKLKNSNLTNELIEWLKSLPTWFVVYIKWAKTEIISDNLVITWELDNSFLSGFDFLVCDDEISNLGKYIEKWITPIIIRDNHMSSILKEFNPLKNEWNSFFYENFNKWDIFYTIVRYIENYKFPFDNKNLVTNVLKV
jgi:hypothetical protein